MTQHPIALLIQQADEAINREDFDTLIDFYTEDAVLVIKPGVNAVGKAQIGSPEFMVGARSAPTINSAFRLFDV